MKKFEGFSTFVAQVPPHVIDYFKSFGVLSDQDFLLLMEGAPPGLYPRIVILRLEALAGVDCSIHPYIWVTVHQSYVANLVLAARNRLPEEPKTPTPQGWNDDPLEP